MKFKHIVMSILLLTTIAGATELRISEEFFNSDIVMFYLSDFNLENPQSNPLIFEYRISNAKEPGECVFNEPVMVSYEFTLKARIFSLGWSQFETIAHVVLNPFPLYGSMRISNQILGSAVDENQVMYDCPQAGAFVDMNGGTISIDSQNMAAISNLILTTNQLPGGTYSFIFTVVNESNGTSASLDKNISISSPTMLNLVNPGSNSSDPDGFSAIYTKYPVFQWESENCGSCEYGIRISEYIPGQHNSPAEALQDESSLPFPDDGQYYPLGMNVNMLNYDPTVSGKEFEFGHSYVWQVTKKYMTSGGDEAINSEIYRFTVVDPSTGTEGVSGPSDPVSLILKQIVGTEQFNQLFTGDGPLGGFSSTGTVKLNGNPVSIGELDNIRNGFQNGSYSIQNITVE